ncbi:SAV_2336 N-terminal domain-related protein [Actinokineospora globicatena]|uniref:SAV_2336 N-terminal domain-related protein n=1 Tax=Actinokineospora globicatena TaxID=103729 RepID=UPI0020A41F82|nr:SAV_2336 N-terminal domain-related protein [Actinokineospora globicatena]MCP2302762.1 hypothetical protein [Actinokineospora globicatena]GLW75548.1 hypothetical protein Aglo01_00300 [Actinokineospora globicatena]GLW82389.1 hypothetical protein Aglo02_00300 [Actinokineospora globicatena]
MADALPRVVAALVAAAPDLDIWAVADAVWLAGHVPLPPVEPVAVPATLPAVEPPTVPVAPVAETLPLTPRPVVERTPSSPQRRPGKPTTVPVTRASVDVLAMGRALRPLLLPWRNGVRSRLDVDATVERYAADGVLVPITAPEPERWFDVVVVVDRSTTMSLWHDDVAAFVTLLRRMGAFRQVRVWQIAPDSATVLDENGPITALPRRLRTPGSRRLVMFLSDFTAAGWRSGPLWNLVHEAAATTPTVIIDPLPQRLWRHSALNQRRVRVHAHAPGRLASGALPAVSLTPSSVARWSHALMRGGTAGCDAVVGTPRPGGRSTTAEATESFLHTATPAAVRLGVLCSHFARFGLPLLHLVRQTMVPEAGLTDVAEFLASGLLTVVTPDPRYPVLAYRPDAAPLIQDHLTHQDAWDLVEALTAHIATHHGPDGVSALILDPAARATLPAETQEFANAAADLLDTLDAADPVATPAPAVVREVPEFHTRIVKVLSSRDRTALLITSRLALALCPRNELPDQVELSVLKNPKPVAGTVIWRHEGLALITTTEDVVPDLPPVRWGTPITVGDTAEHTVIGASLASTRLILTTTLPLSDNVTVEYPRHIRDANGYTFSGGAVVFHHGLVAGVVPTLTPRSHDNHPVITTQNLLSRNNFREVVAAHAGACFPEPLELAEFSSPPPTLPTFGHIRTPAPLLNPTLGAFPTPTEQPWLDTYDLLSATPVLNFASSQLPASASLTSRVAIGLPSDWSVVWLNWRVLSTHLSDVWVRRGPVLVICHDPPADAFGLPKHLIGKVYILLLSDMPLPINGKIVTTPTGIRNPAEIPLRRSKRIIAGLQLRATDGLAYDLEVDHRASPTEAQSTFHHEVAAWLHLFDPSSLHAVSMLVLLSPADQKRATEIAGDEHRGVAEKLARIYPSKSRYISAPKSVQHGCFELLNPRTLDLAMHEMADYEKVLFLDRLDKAQSGRRLESLALAAAAHPRAMEILVNLAPTLTNQGVVLDALAQTSALATRQRIASLLPDHSDSLAEFAVAITRWIPSQRPRLATWLNRANRSSEVLEIGSIRHDSIDMTNEIAVANYALENYRQSFHQAELAATGYFAYREQSVLSWHNYSITLSNQAVALAALGNPDRALQVIKESLAIDGERHDERNLSTTLINAAIIEHATSSRKAVQSNARAALDGATQQAAVNPDGHATHLADVQITYARLSIPDSSATELALRAVATFRNSRRPPATLARALSILAMAQCATGDLDSALNSAEEAVALATRQKRATTIADAFEARAAVQREMGRLHSADDCHRTAIAIYRDLVPSRPELRLDLAICVNNLGITRDLMGDAQGAINAHAEAVQIFRSLVAVNTGAYRVELATCLANLALAQHPSPDARATADEALAIFQDLAHNDPGHEKALQRTQRIRDHVHGDG